MSIEFFKVKFFKSIKLLHQLESLIICAIPSALHIHLRQVREWNLVFVFNFHFYWQYVGINTLNSQPSYGTACSFLYKFATIKLNSLFFLRLLVLIFVRISVFNLNSFPILKLTKVFTHTHTGNWKRKKREEEKINSICESFFCHYFYTFEHTL